MHLLPIVPLFKWIELREMPMWSSGEAPIQKFVNYLIERKCLESKEIDQLFTEFSNVKSYLKSQPNIFNEWEQNHTSIIDRWGSIFAHLKKQSLPFKVFFKLVEYVFVIPGKKTLNTLSNFAY